MAQCTGGGACELPTGLPWYFGLAVGVIWLALVVGAIGIGRRLLARRFERRRRESDQLALGRATSTTEIERW